MIGKTNVGGGIRAYAYIVVAHDTNATVTCTYSKRIIELADDMTLILVSDGASSCVVTATTSGGVTNTQTVSITSGESYYVLLYNKHTFILNGVKQGNNLTTAGKRPSAGSGVSYTATPNVTYATGYIQIDPGQSGTYSSTGIAYFPETIDLSKYTTLHVSGQARRDMEKEFCGVNVWTGIGEYFEDYRLAYQPFLNSLSNSYTDFSVTVDVSTYTGSAYVGFCVRRGNGGTNNIRLKEAWVD